MLEPGAAVMKVDINFTPAKVAVEGTGTDRVAAEAHITTAAGFGETVSAGAANETLADTRVPLGGVLKDGSTDVCIPLGGVLEIAQDTTTQAMLAGGWESRASVIPSLSCSISLLLLPK